MEDEFLSIKDIELFANELQEFGLDKDQGFTDVKAERLETIGLHTIEEILPMQSSRTRGRPRKLELSGYTKKPEEMDKFWLRAFRRYFISEFTNKLEENSKTSANFWNWYFSSEGIPSKSNKYKSYSTKYKNKLFRNESFCKEFKAFFDEHASYVLDSSINKIPQDSQKRDIYYSYGRIKLYWYEQSEFETNSHSKNTNFTTARTESELGGKTNRENLEVSQNTCMWNR